MSVGVDIMGEQVLETCFSKSCRKSVIKLSIVLNYIQHCVCSIAPTKNGLVCLSVEALQARVGLASTGGLESIITWCWN